MYKKKEVCRNFQRGSCQYGDRCKFLHVTPQQPKSFNNPVGFPNQQSPNGNPFGFGNQQQQQRSNNTSFGFGNNNNNRPQPFKPFENKWVRSNEAAAAPSSRQQPDNRHSQGANHRCTDPDSCKSLIAEDFEHERPLWKLTCYSHLRNGPCDITGDVSYEELRAAAYDDAKQGLSLQSIVERERNLLNSKLIEFDNLLRHPYIAPSKSAPASHSPFSGATPNATPAVPPSVSSFSQLGASHTMGFGTRPAAPPNNAFGQPNQPLSPFGTRTSAPSNSVFGQSNLSSSRGVNNFPSANISNFGQNSSAFGINNFSPANAGTFGSQFPNQAPGSSFPTGSVGFGNTAVNSFQSVSPSASSMQNLSNVQPLPISNGPNSAPNAAGQTTTSIQPVNTVQTKTFSGDPSIWLKEKWVPGEIPEEAPPDEYVF